jgi:hypothetical protein
VKFLQAQKTVLIPEPYALVRPLPACSNCNAIHPLARKPAMDVDKCPDCGTPLEQVEAMFVKAALGGVWGFLFNLCVGVGKGLLKLGRAIMPEE